MSHKVKGQKVDLASLYSGPGVESSLPSAPDPNREPYDRRRGRGGGRGGGGFDRERGGGRFERGGERGGFGGGGYDERRSDDDAGPWRRAGPPDRSYRDSGSRGGYGGRDRDFGDRDGFGGGFRGGRDRGYGDRQDSYSPAGERPKLNLAPRTLPVDQSSAPAVNDVTERMGNMDTGSASSAPADKWETVFKKPSRFGGDAPQDSRFGDRGGRSFGDRGSGGFGDRGSGGFGDRRGGGFGDRDRSRDYGGRDFGSRYDSGGRSAYASTNRYDTEPEPIDDPRFAGKFGGSASRGAPQETQSARPAVPDAALAAIPIVEKSNKKDTKAAEERKAAAEAKAAKAAAKAEAERLEAERKLAEKEAEKAAIAKQRSIAATLVKGGKKGDSLTNDISELSEKPSGAALVAEILSSLSVPTDVAWCTPDEYGSALSSLLQDNTKGQMMAIYELQQYCQKISFPKIDTKSGKRAYFEVIFQLFYQFDIVDNTGFQAWFDDEMFDELPGRTDALVQATEFMNWLNEEELEEEDEDEEIEGLEPAPRN
mmetsp:Transcript_424/g.802  ORF Transcript_424/g.802 Transcript_424/m.802 type:complete len:539 (-) Transcript_424:248-1864(-)